MPEFTPYIGVRSLNRIRQRDTRTPAVLLHGTEFVPDPWGGSGMTYESEVLHGTVLGEQKVIIDFKDDMKYNPDIYRNNPVDIRRNRFTCTEGGIELLASNSLYNTVQTLTGPLASYYTGAVGAFPNLSRTMVMDPDRVDRARLKAYANLGKPDFDSALFVLEIVQTLSMLVPLLKGLNNAWKWFAQKPANIRAMPARWEGLREWIKHPSKASKYFSDKWLEYRFGILPLISDIADIQGLVLANSIDFTSKVEISKGTVKELTVDKLPKAQYLILNKYVLLNIYTERQIEDKVVVGLFYIDRMTMAIKRAYQLGVAPSQVLNLVYNLTPLSFVLDWGWNFGDWLATALPVQGRIPFDSHTSLVKRQMWTSTALDYETRKGTVIDYLPSIYQCTSDRLLRTVSNNIPPTASAATTGSVFNLQRTFDSLALSHQLIPGAFSPRRIK